MDLCAPQKEESIAKIEKIRKQVVEIEETLERYKTKTDNLKLSYENPLVFDQQLHHAAKTNRYETGVLSEFLMKQLMQLDNCLSYGCGVIKSSRKALVCRIKETMTQADSLSQQWLKHVQALEKLKTSGRPKNATPSVHNGGGTGADRPKGRQNTTCNSQTTSPSSSKKHTETKQRECTLASPSMQTTPDRASSKPYLTIRSLMLFFFFSFLFFSYERSSLLVRAHNTRTHTRTHTHTCFHPGMHTQTKVRP